MDLSMLWTPLILGAVVILAVLGGALLFRSWSQRPLISAEERRELASAPMAPMQKRAWLGLVVSSTTFGVIATTLFRRGAMTYWEDDDLRLTMVGIFIGGLLLHTLVPLLAWAKAELAGNVDERDRAILARAPLAQSTGVLIALAIWVGSLGQMFHDEGAVPMVYMYLLFGSIILVNLIAQSVGILLGYWLGARHGEG